MTLQQYEESRHQGEPVNLYLYRYGVAPGAYYAYNDGEEIISIEGVDYIPVPMQRSPINSDGTLDKSALTVSCPRDLDIVELFRVYPPHQVVTLVIRQGHPKDAVPEYLVIWSGRVTSRNIKGDECEFTCEPISSSMRRSGLRRNYQFGCPHALYGPQCNASKAAATFTQTVISVANNEVTLADGWNGGEPLNHFYAGLAEWQHLGETVIRSILNIEFDKVVIMAGPAIGLLPGDSIDIIKGCDHTMVGCNDHNNIQNFGGQPWIPTKNPITGISPFG